jgi:hypothetical protein
MATTAVRSHASAAAWNGGLRPPGPVPVARSSSGAGSSAALRRAMCISVRTVAGHFGVAVRAVPNRRAPRPTPFPGRVPRHRPKARPPFGGSSTSCGCDWRSERGQAQPESRRAEDREHQTEDTQPSRQAGTRWRPGPPARRTSTLKDHAPGPATQDVAGRTRRTSPRPTTLAQTCPGRTCRGLRQAPATFSTRLARLTTAPVRRGFRLVTRVRRVGGPLRWWRRSGSRSIRTDGRRQRLSGWSARRRTCVGRAVVGGRRWNGPREHRSGDQPAAGHRSGRTGAYSESNSST